MHNELKIKTKQNKTKQEYSIDSLSFVLFMLESVRA